MSQNRIKEARKYAAQIHHDLADNAFNEELSGLADHVDKQEYADRQRSEAMAIESGERDHKFTVRQRIHYFLTGEDVPFLSKSRCGR